MKAILKVAMLTVVGFGIAGAANAGSYPKEIKKCKACHTYQEGDKHKIGPNLLGVFGRTAGSVATFKKYSTNMKKAGEGDTPIVWNEENLNKYLENPKKFIKKTKMTKKFKKEKDRVKIIAFLKAAAKPAEEAKPAQ